MKRKRMSDIISVKISTDMRDEIDDIAHQRRVSMSELLREYIGDGIKRNVEA